ncbi:unnamed protein product [Lactuca virosa]|uniref:Uncharacterized protein n=1 Tax=Lactuca virosa TaxID=75947 RepID=A0AAU9MAR6_9ASTR|nr:unnamed protein product [Lactuca virosa]
MFLSSFEKHGHTKILILFHSIPPDSWWVRLIRLDWQGTSMEGPIPSTISLLTNLQELKINDLTGLKMVKWSFSLEKHCWEGNFGEGRS